MSTLSELLARIRVLPVLTVRSPQSATALVGALVRGGVAAVEITLRTPEALDAIVAIRRAFPDLPVGAGTVLDADDLSAAMRAGATFAVSPGFTDMLVAAAGAQGVPLLPGIATSSEVLRGRELGLDCFKLFPAKALNGLELLRSFADPLRGIRFVPTGGLDERAALDYFALPNVVCVAGSWLAPTRLVEAGAWAEITRLARQSMDHVSRAAKLSGR